MAALLALPLFPSEVSAQAASRFRVMVTNLMPGEDTDDDFGKDLAKELRELINELPTHQPVSWNEIKDGAKQFNIDEDELNCIRSLQLATQINAQLVMCGEYTENKDAKTFSLSGVQFAAPGGASFAIEDKTWGEKEHEQAAQEIFTSFETYVDQLRVAQFCGDYFNSKDYQSADGQCSRAIEMNPSDAQVRYIYARTLMELDRNEEAYEQAKEVVDLDPLHEDGLLTVGYLATTMGNRDEGRGFYNTYLQLNPGNAQVRMNIAYDMAQAGDPEGGMLLIEEGLANDAENTDMLIMHAGFASSAAADAKRAAGQVEELPPDVAALYQRALESYDGAYAVLGAEMEAAHLRNMIAAHNELGQLDQAVTMAERALETHDQEAQLWSIYADVLKRADRLDDAIAALDATSERDAEYQNVKAREASWRLEAGQVEESVAAAQMAVERGRADGGRHGADVLRQRLQPGHQRQELRPRHPAPGIGEEPVRGVGRRGRAVGLLARLRPAPGRHRAAGTADAADRAGHVASVPAGQQPVPAWSGVELRGHPAVDQHPAVPGRFGPVHGDSAGHHRPG